MKNTIAAILFLTIAFTTAQGQSFNFVANREPGNSLDMVYVDQCTFATNNSGKNGWEGITNVKWQTTKYGYFAQYAFTEPDSRYTVVNLEIFANSAAAVRIVRTETTYETQVDAVPSCISVDTWKCLSNIKYTIHDTGGLFKGSNGN